MKRTKIVCTIGPASAKPATLLSMIRAGMNVARLNFSHGTYPAHTKLYRAIRAAAKKAGEPVAILADLQGPKIRLGELPPEGVELKTGETVLFTTATKQYKNGQIPVTYTGLHKDLEVGHRLLIEDGIYELVVTKIVGKTIGARVVNGGTVTSHKGMNFPDSTLRVSSLSEKDRADAVFAIGLGVEWIALSFVTCAEDVRELRALVARACKKIGRVVPPRIIVKIEKHEAIKQFDEILSVTDGVMVARGDLGVEIAAEEVPVRQKEIVEKCRLAGKPVVVATQMLDSMIRNPRPTRAEVSDVANAVFDHADAVMLSGESATGKYPLAAVKAMANIVTEAESSRYDDVSLTEHNTDSEEADIAHALKTLALGRHISAILASKTFAPWSEHLLQSRAEIPLFIAADDETQARQLNIRWGVRPFVLKGSKVATFLEKAVRELRKRRWMKARTRVALVPGGAHGEGFDIVTVK